EVGAQQPRAGRTAFAAAIHAAASLLVIGPWGAVFAWTSVTNCVSALQALALSGCPAWARSFVSLSRSFFWLAGLSSGALRTVVVRALNCAAAFSTVTVNDVEAALP